MTTADISNRDQRLILRMLLAFYLGAVAVGCFVGLVITGRLTFVAAGIAACFGAWCVTGPLDELRREVTT